MVGGWVADSPFLFFGLPPFAIAVHCSAKKGVTNDGTIVHRKAREKREREAEDGTIVH
jgi:hypothetical protein